MDLGSIAEVGTGAIGGGISVASVAWFFFNRYIQRTDKKHDEHDAAIKDLSKGLSEVNTGIRVIEARIGEALSLRDQVTDNVRDIAVNYERIDRCQNDIDKGLQSVRKKLGAI